MSDRGYTILGALVLVVLGASLFLSAGLAEHLMKRLVAAPRNLWVLDLMSFLGIVETALGGAVLFRTVLRGKP